MLKELRVKNFAIVEDGTLELSRGMTAFTGETGAGKSLLLNAITLLLGAKSRSDLVRSGAKVAEVEGVFDLSKDRAKRERVRELGFDWEEDEEPWLVVRRELSSQDGRNRIWIQGRSANRSQLQNLLGDWIEVSGQHEFLRLGSETYLLTVLDHFGGLKAEVAEYGESFKAYQKLKTQYEEASHLREHKNTRLDYLHFQIEELEKAGIHSQVQQDEDSWTHLKAKLSHVEKIRGVMEFCRKIIEGWESEESLRSVLSQFNAIEKELKSISDLGPEFQKSLSKVEELIEKTSELLSEVQMIEKTLESDPESLEMAEAKLSVLKRLKRKYNVETPQLLSILQEAQSEKLRLEQAADLCSHLKEQSEILCLEVSKKAQHLHVRRIEAAKNLSEEWMRDLQALGLGQARLELRIHEKTQLSSDGVSGLEALFSANPGESLKPLAKVASGGELSRLMLALKNVVSGSAEVGVYLFDEVDAGVGGETAQQVGKRLQNISKENQVLVVTHLAPVAAHAHHQFSIEKKIEKGRTKTRFYHLKKQTERAIEIARMLGNTESKAAKVLADELLLRAAP